MTAESQENDKSEKNKWLKITGLALSYPSTIFVTAYGLKLLVDEEIISKTIGLLIFLGVLFNTLILMVVYAYRKKN